MVTHNAQTNYTRVAPNVRAVTRKKCKYYTQVTQMMHEGYTRVTPGQQPLHNRVTCGLHTSYARITPRAPGHTSSAPRRDLGVALVSTVCHSGVQKKTF